MLLIAEPRKVLKRGDAIIMADKQNPIFALVLFTGYGEDQASTIRVYVVSIQWVFSRGLWGSRGICLGCISFSNNRNGMHYSVLAYH